MDIQGPHNITLPVHEVITAGSLAKAGVLKAEDSYYVDYEYIHGVLWNDDPGGHFYYCDGHIDRHLWSGLMWVAKFKFYGLITRIKSDICCHPDAPLMSRSHYGNMQFLHSMKPVGCDDFRTREYILAWAEFCYRLSIGDIDEMLLLSQVDVPLIAELFPAHSRHGKEPIAKLFKTGKCPSATPKRAMGSLLHMIQDSYSALHTKRIINSDGSKGAIIEFYNLAEQVNTKHVHTEANAFPKKFDSTLYSVNKLDAVIAKIDGGREAEAVGVEVLQGMLAKKPWNTYMKAFLVNDVFCMEN